MTARSAKIGTTILPTVSPTPNALSTKGTVLGATCVTAVSVSARYVYTENKPPKPTAPIASVIQTWPRPSALSSRSGLALWSAGVSGA
ncbi:hypothetical protein D3C71_1877780 [compost metagenome]